MTNNLPFSDMCNQQGLRDLVNFPTRYHNQLDSILTGIKDCKEARGFYLWLRMITFVFLWMGREQLVAKMAKCSKGLQLLSENEI